MTAVTRSAQKRKSSAALLEQEQRLLRKLDGTHINNHDDNTLLQKKLSFQVITASKINECLGVLFPGEEVSKLPCSLARIFAAFSLSLDHKVYLLLSSGREPNKFETPLLPILPLLRALVNVESISLENEKWPAENSSTKVSFCGIDCSSVRPPVDRVEGSGAHQEKSIQALLKAKNEVAALLSNNSNGSPSVTSCLDNLLEFLSIDDDNNNVDKSWVAECAKAIHPMFPAQRVVNAVKLCRRDIAQIRQRTKENGLTTSCHPDDALMIEKRLVDLIGQAIRYHLRLFFNSSPPRLCQEDVEYEKRVERYSQVKDLVVLTMKDNYSNEAVDDSFLSALVSNALSIVCDYIGLENLLYPSAVQVEVPDLFCGDQVSNQGFRVRGPPVTLSDDDLQRVVNDIETACDFLAVAYACRFLVGLLAIQGVQDEIDRQGGWEQVETYASISWNHQLWKLCPSDEHLVSLSNVKVLLERLQFCLPVFMGRVNDCEESLQALAKRFHVTSKTKNVLSKFPQIPLILRSLAEGRELAYSFPAVTAAKPM